MENSLETLRSKRHGLGLPLLELSEMARLSRNVGADKAELPLKN
jgi:hypothetical protein